MYWVLRGVAFLFRFLPQKVAYFFGIIFGKIMQVVLAGRNDICYKNLDIVFKNQATKQYKKKIIDRMYKNLGLNIITFFRIPNITKENFRKYVSVKNEDILNKIKASKKGFIVVTAHYGCWDILPLYFAFNGFSANFITKEVRNKSVNRFWMEYRSYGGVNPIFKKNSAKKIIKIIKEGGIIGFVIDQNMNERNGVFVDFFGVKACTTDAPAKLALKFNCPVVPIFCERNGFEKFTINICSPVPLKRGRNNVETILNTTREYTKVFEKFILERPDHWIWMHKRWKTRPSGEKNFY